MSDTYSIGILTVSDRCFRGEAEDESGPYLRKVIEDSRKLNNPNFVIKCVPDEVPEIEETLKEWADIRKLDAVFTTGGTGFAPRDVTPEATRHVIEKEAPSIASAILYHTLAKTKMAMLSRSVCGIRKRCLIINFPGSKKAVGECLDVVIDCIPHALSLLRNDTMSVTTTHQALQAAVKSKVDVSRVARRARESTFPMVDVEQSLQITSKIVAKIFSLSSEEVPIEQTLGRVMTEPAAATCSLPPYRASVMDGYAAISSDGLGPREVVSAMVAGSQPLSGGVLRSGQCARVNTGAPVLPGADCVVKVEDTRVLQETSDGREELRIDVLVAPTPGQYIREIGSDVKEGDVVLQVSQTPITSSQVGLLASVGIFSVPVYRLPRVALLSTGNELQLPGHKLEPGQIWDSNKIMLLSLLKENGFPAVDLGIAKDEQDETLAKLKEGMEFADVIVTTGSVSMGDRDLLKQILKEDLNAEIHFGRVNLKPGKPTTFATCQGPKNRPILFFCLPGNPVSAIVTCHLYVLPSLRYISGQKQLYSQIVKAQIQSELRLDPRVEFKRGIYKAGDVKSPATVQIVGSCMLSSNLLSISTANCLVQLPSMTQENPVLNKNSWVDCWLTKDL